MIVPGFIIVNDAKYTKIIIKDKRQQCSVWNNNKVFTMEVVAIIQQSEQTNCTVQCHSVISFSISLQR